MTRREIIAERIKIMRMSRGMTQQDLAAALHCAQSTIAMYETGKRTPDMETIDYLADIFNVAPYSIIFRDDEVVPAHSIQDALSKINEELTTPSRSKEWRMLSKAFGRMEEQNEPEFMGYFNMLRMARPDLFDEGEDDHDPKP